jgi:hypothetical protein
VKARCSFCGEEVEPYVMRGTECISCVLDLGDMDSSGAARLLRALAARIARMEARNAEG